MAARYAEVAVDASLPPDRTLTYAIPPGISVAPGHVVWAPLQSRRVSGVVFALSDHTEVGGVRPLGGLQDPSFALAPAQLELARWLSRETLCSLYEAAALMLPWDFRRRLLSLLWTTEKVEGEDPSQRGDEERRMLAALQRTTPTDERRVVRTSASRTALRRLLREGLVLQEWRWDPPRATPQYRETLHLAVPAEEVQQHAVELLDRLHRLKTLLQILEDTPFVDLTTARKEFGSSAVTTLQRQDLVAIDRPCLRLAVSVEEARQHAATLPDRSHRLKALLRSLAATPSMDLTASRKEFGSSAAATLQRRNLVTVDHGRRLRLAASVKEARQYTAGLPDTADRARALLEYLADTPSVDITAARKEFGASVVKRLVERGLVTVEQHRRLRDPLAAHTTRRQAPLQPTPDQSSAIDAIASSVQRADGGTFLLLGVTGSGKTEVYLQALARCISQGRRGLYLVPEIALTPQLTARLLARFPGRVGLLHSGLSDGQQYDAWWRIHRGDFDVVLGSRSAIFAPVPDIGLVILDEEHEWTYKQQDLAPRYHARDVALKLAELTGATVVLGSATPDLVSHHHARQGVHRLLELPQRLAPGDDGRPRTVPLPKAQVVDMRKELKAGVRSIFSRSLHEALTRTLERGEQAILFLNRRGASGIVQCRDCGHVLRCRSCDAPLTYHAVGERMVCHHCGRRRPQATRCPDCRGSRIRHLGIGTQRVVQEVEQTFGARVLRWDQDAARDRAAHEALMDSFARGEADVLVGTQMVAKGLDLPRVSLVGAILADLGLHLPDFRSAERTFQLLCQVAGRAGRLGGPGQAVIQTYSPEHYAVRLAAAQDYGAFAAAELDFRRTHAYPPYSRLARLLFQHTNPAYAQREADAVAARIRAYCAREGLGEVDVIGPAPAYPPRLRGRYRWHLVVRVPVGAPVDLPALLASLGPLPGWRLDVDPVSLV